MEWTMEADQRLAELHAKRVSPAFIASWMRWPAPAVRSRLVELGLVKPLSQRGAAITAAATRPRSQATARVVEVLVEAVDDDADLKTSPGCPRGHLMTESKIAALYRRAGCSYR
jgi:hypothetical protein